MGQPVENALGLRKAGRIRAKQIAGSPDYPVQNLYPCYMEPSDYVFWLLNSLSLTEGIVVRADGIISYAPAMVTRMRITSFRVVLYVDAFHEDARYDASVRYCSKDGLNHEQVVPDVAAAEMDKLVFDIPLEHVDAKGWFTCVVQFKLLTPIPKDSPEKPDDDLLEMPCHPVIIRGAHLEIKG
jgi:hypothetical protein